MRASPRCDPRASLSGNDRRHSRFQQESCHRHQRQRQSVVSADRENTRTESCPLSTERQLCHRGAALGGELQQCRRSAHPGITLMPTQARNVLIMAVVAVLLIAMAAVTVRESELAIKFSFGKIVRADYEPGLHFKIPFINNVRKFEKRIVSPRDYPAEQFLTSEGKILRIDFYIKWRISDVERYYQATSGGDPEDIAAGRLGSIVKDGIK